MLIFLIGMPGSGKTSIGRELARETGYRLMDLDAYIVDKEKLSIPNIFKTKGEEYFRAAETHYLKELVEKAKDSIIAVGGGTPCYNNNMQLMQNGGKTIYLKASVDSLVKRIESDSNERPLFAKMNGKKLREKIDSMLSHREKFYRKAPMNFDTEGRTPAQCAKELAPLLK